MFYWFNHHFGLLINLLSNLWCIFVRVFPSQLSISTVFQGAHSSHPPCVRTSHSPSLTHCSSHTLATDKVILLVSMWNHSQGINIRPTAGTPTPNNLRSNLDFLPGRSTDMLAGLTSSTLLELEGGSDDKLCPLILFWTFSHLSWSLVLSSLHDVFCMPNLLPSQGSFSISYPHTGTMCKSIVRSLGEEFLL